MNEIETTIPESATASIVPTTGDNFELSAQNPAEMVQCHSAAIEWAKRKIQLVQNETKELEDAYVYAKGHKWRWQTLHKHWQLSSNRLEFYKKMLAAFEAGYYIVPNFPAAVFAIRTDKSKPSPNTQFGYVYQPSMNVSVTNPLSVGEGEYKNPTPVVAHNEYTLADGKGTAVADYRAIAWKEMEFPANMAKLHIMQATTRAMALKVFDEVLMLPSDGRSSGSHRVKQPDPMIIGRIVCRGKSPYRSDWQRVSFMIGWHIDTKTL